MKKVAILIVLLGLAVSSRASHVLGAEIGYTHLGGLQYEVWVNLYGDCSGSSYPGYFDPTTVAVVDIYNGSGPLYTTLNCTRYGDYGKEITPVCAQDSNNTKCVSPNGTIPGIAEFKFRGTVTLNQTSANWRFAFAGRISTGNALAGRSNSITNIQFGTNGSIVYLEAILNNLNGPNNSPNLTTIPTPFFCLNQLQEYNIGAVDPDTDSLSFSLVSGLGAVGGNSTLVSYLAGYSGAQPLAASSFNFDNQSGQLSFVANQTQTSMVVNKIEEYRNGVLVGSMMREMNFIVLNNCSNLSPTGSFDTTNAGAITATNVIEVCNADSAVSFSIAAQDPDNGSIDVQLSGVPTGMTYVINGNNTQSPKINFDFTLPQPIVPGTNYSFFVTFQDDGCPISSKQQVAYTIKVIDPIIVTPTSIAESCVPGGDGLINVAATSSNAGSMEYAFNGGPFQALNTFTGLSTGNYTVLIRDTLGCATARTVFVDTATKVHFAGVVTNDISCFSKSDGSVQLSSIPNSLPTSFTILPNNISNSIGRFENLAVGTYTAIVNAPLGCSDTTTFSLSSPPDISFTNINIIDNRCDLRTGRIEIGSNITIPVEYSISPNQQTNSYGEFGGLIAGYYIVTVQDTNGCYKDTLLEVKDDPGKMVLSLSKQDVSCEGDGNDGQASVFVAGAIQPVNYYWTSEFGTEGTTATISNQRSGIKLVKVVDAIGCEENGYIFVDPANCCSKVFIPSAFSPNGDGKNETFRMRTPLTMNEVKFFVVNRWGQKVWETNQHLEGWDGTYQNGTTADVGTYYYFLTYKCATDEQTYTLKGDITLIR